MKKVLLIAHRGGEMGIYENKIETIKKTLKNDLVDVVEVDVRKTKDNILVLSHNRGIDINGKRFWIDEVSYDKIKHLGIPTLEEILPLFVNSDKILNIDLKQSNLNGELTHLLTKYQIKRLFFDSYDINALLDLQSEFKFGEYFLSSSIKDTRDFSRNRILRIVSIFLSILLARLVIFILKKRITKAKINGLSLHYLFVNKSFLKDLKDFGFKIFVWFDFRFLKLGAETEKKIKELINMGVDGIKIIEVEKFKKCFLK